MKKTKNLFKNSGIRSLAEETNTFFNRLKYIFHSPQKRFFTYKHVPLLGWAISSYLSQKYNTPCNIIIGTDTRTSGIWIKKDLIKGLFPFPHHIFDAEIIPTPFIAQTIKNHMDPETGLPFFQLGIIITASHNPAEYNGIKIITPEGYLTLEDECNISELFYKIKKNPIDFLPSNNFFSISLLPRKEIIPFDCISNYESNLKKQLSPSKTPSQIKMLLDCAHGATSFIGKKIFQPFYSNIITINDEGNGALINKNSGCTNVQLLIQAIKEHDAQWGCAFDGDGDRVIIANSNGDIFDGDDILVILSQHPRFASQTTFVGTIMTNNAIEQYFQKNHKTFLRTDVGERNIIQTLQQHHAQLGSEACGHITVMDHAYCSDGIFAALLFFETIHVNHQALQNLPLKFPQLHATIPLHMLSLNDTNIQDLVQKTNETIYPGRIIARTSNTEPVFRLTVEHPSIEIATQTMNKIKQAIANNN